MVKVLFQKEVNLDSFVDERRAFKNIFNQNKSAVEPSSHIHPKIWNQREAAIEGIARKTTAIEGCNYGLKALFIRSNPEFRNF